MVSPTNQTRKVRNRKAARAGSARKAKLNRSGTTLPASELFKVVEPKKD